MTLVTIVLLLAILFVVTGTVRIENVWNVLTGWLRWLAYWLEGHRIKDLEIKMSKKVKMQAKGKLGMPMPAQTLSSLGASVQLVPVDSNGNPVTVTDPSAVTSTFTSDNPAFAISKGVDSLHYKASVPAGSTGLANLTATLTSNLTPPAFSPVNSTLPLTLDVPAGIADLEIILAPLA